MNSASLPPLPLPTSLEGVYFVTLRLRDALPESFSQNLGLQYYNRQVEIAQGPHRSEHLHMLRKVLFKRFDIALDLGKYGSSRLHHPLLAQIVADAIQELDGKMFDVLAYAVLPNHIHLLLDLHTSEASEPNALDIELIDCKALRASVDRLRNTLEQSLKIDFWQMESSAPPTTFHKHRSNGTIQSSGKIWHERSFDFPITTAAEFEKCAHFIFQNPVSAELTTHWQDWPYLFWKQ